jgi:hypothetical protein
MHAGVRSFLAAHLNTICPTCNNGLPLHLRHPIILRPALLAAAQV